MKHTEKWYRAMKERMSGSRNPMFKNAKLPSVCRQCGSSFTFYKGCSGGKFCSQSCANASPETRTFRSLINKGRKHTAAAKQKMSVARKGKKKPAGFGDMVRVNMKKFWDARGRKSDFSTLVKSSKEYKDWVKGVIARANATCEDCGAKPGKIDAHHLTPLSVLLAECQIGIADPANIHTLDNGRALCRPCHKRHHKAGTRFHQLIEGRLFILLRKLHRQECPQRPFADFYVEKMSGYIGAIQQMVVETTKLKPE